MILTSLLDALGLSLFSIVMVFVLLLLVTVIVEGLKDQVKKKPPVVSTHQASDSVEIKDEDMLVAVLVATIDYREETKSNIIVKSVKEIR